MPGAGDSERDTAGAEDDDPYARLRELNSSRHRPETRPGGPSTAYLVARFTRFYGIGAYRDAGWPTRDGVVPAALFLLLLRKLAAVSALEQLDHYHAALLAAAHVQGGKEVRPAIDRAVRSLTAIAEEGR